MLKANKRLQKIVRLMADNSFDPKGELDTKKVIFFVSQLKKLHNLDAIQALNEFKKILAKKIDDGILYIESAITLSRTDIDQIEKNLPPTFHPLHSTFKINPSLLGGLRLKIADTVIDSSLKRKEQELKEVIING